MALFLWYNLYLGPCTQFLSSLMAPFLVRGTPPFGAAVSMESWTQRTHQLEHIRMLA